MVGLDCCGRPGIVSVVLDRRIERAPSEFLLYVEMPTDAFLDELRAETMKAGVTRHVWSTEGIGTLLTATCDPWKGRLCLTP